MPKRAYYVYMLTNASRKPIYTGVTGNLAQRVGQHRDPENTGYTSRYKLTRLVHCEEFHYVYDALAREKQIKKWRYSWKVELIESVNPEWRDFAEEEILPGR